MAALSLILGCAATRKCALSAKFRSSLEFHIVFDSGNESQDQEDALLEQYFLESTEEPFPEANVHGDVRRALPVRGRVRERPRY